MTNRHRKQGQTELRGKNRTDIIQLGSWIKLDGNRI